MVCKSDVIFADTYIYIVVSVLYFGQVFRSLLLICCTKAVYTS